MKTHLPEQNALLEPLHRRFRLVSSGAGILPANWATSPVLARARDVRNGRLGACSTISSSLKLPASFLLLLLLIYNNPAAGVVGYTFQSFSNATTIAIPAEGPATPYPSSITVNGITGRVAKITITLANLDHDYPSDLDLLLVGPLGQSALFMSDVGGEWSASDLTLTFDDDALAPMPHGAPIVSGTFQPSDYAGEEIFWERFVSPAPAGPYTNSALSVFADANPNGRWDLFVMDNVEFQGGQIRGGWSLTFAAEQALITNANRNASFVQFARASAEARSSTMIAVQAPFTGDDNHDGYTTFEIGPSLLGPWTDSGLAVPGPSEWRASAFRVAPGSTTFIRVTFQDPDGVVGPATNILGPIITPASSTNSVMVEPSFVEVHDTEIFVSVPIRDDANWNSSGTISLATSANGPWEVKCSGLPFHPKRGRLRSLTPDTNYWIRVTITDPDGVSGNGDQIIGPIHYTGLRNLAYRQPVTADPGWGCCPNPQQLVDGRIQDDAWYYGFAWTGGNGHWGGGGPGPKQATIDLGVLTSFNRATVWFHQSDNVPLVWEFQSSLDGISWQDAYSNTSPICRTTNGALTVSSGYPSCAHDARFAAPVLGRYFRYSFDDQTLINGVHGWVEEIEVFGEGAVPTPPIITGQPQNLQVAAGSDASFDVVVQSPVPVTYQWQFNGNIISNATTSTLFLVSVSSSNAGPYTVVVSNRFGSVTSALAMLSVAAYAPNWEFVQIPNLPTNCTLGAIWARTNTEVFVWASRTKPDTANVPEAFLFRGDGTNWTQVLHITNHYAGGLFGIGDAEVFAIVNHFDSGTKIFRSTTKGDSGSWVEQTLPPIVANNTLGKISGTASNVHVVVVSGYVGHIIRFDGASWIDIYASSYDDPPYSISVTGPKEGYMVGCWGWGLWNGTNWQWHGRQFDFCDVADTWAMRDSSSALQWYAVGNNNFLNGVRVWRFNEASQSFGSKYGAVFSDGDQPFLGRATDVWGAGAHDIYVAGYLAQTLQGPVRGRLYHYDGANWSRVAEIGEFPDNVIIVGLTGTASDDVWITRGDGQLMHLQSTHLLAPPLILQQPQSIFATSNSVARFSVQATGAPVLTYQWYFNTNQSITGATNAVLEVKTTNRIAGTYDVVVTSAGGSVTSQVATLILLPRPAILLQPRSVQTNTGSQVEFQMLAAPEGEPLRYQWRLNDINIPGATNPYLGLANVQPTDGGSYSVVVLNPVGAILSSYAILVVTNSMNPPLQAVNNDLFEQAFSLTNATGFMLSGSVSGNNRCFTNQPGEPYHAGRTGGRSAWFSWIPVTSGIATFDTVGSTFDTVLAIYTGTNVAALVGTEVANDDDGGPNFASWLQFNVKAGTNYHIALDGFARQSGEYVLHWTNEVTTEELPSIFTPPRGRAVTNGADFNFTVTANGTEYQWLFNRTPIRGATATNLLLTNIQSANVGQYTVVISNSTRFIQSKPTYLEITSLADSDVLSDPKPEALFGPSGSDDCPQPPVPRHQVTAKSTFTSPYLPVAFGSVGLHILNTASAYSHAPPVSGCEDRPDVINLYSRMLIFNLASNGVLNLDTIGSRFPTALFLFQYGQYLPDLKKCARENLLERQSGLTFEVTDAPAYLGVLMLDTTTNSGLINLNWGFGRAPPHFTNNQTRPYHPGDTASFELPVDEPADFTFQWLRNGTNIPGATNWSLVLSNLQPQDKAWYTVLVTNIVGKVTNNMGFLEVGVPPQILTWPSDTNVLQGAAWTNQVLTSGDSPLTFQWYHNNALIAEATNSSYGSTNVGFEAAGEYRIQVINPYGQAGATNRLRVLPSQVWISGDTNDAAACQALSFDARSLTNTVNVMFDRYSWWLGKDQLLNYTNASLSFPAYTLCTPGNYTIAVIASNAGFQPVSNAAPFTLLTAPSFRGPGLLTNGLIRFELVSPWEARHRILETSSNLNNISWLPVATNSGTNGVIEFSLPAEESQRYYRIRLERF